jgi:hypothetical protein
VLGLALGVGVAVEVGVGVGVGVAVGDGVGVGVGDTSPVNLMSLKMPVGALLKAARVTELPTAEPFGILSIRALLTFR